MRIDDVPVVTGMSNACNFARDMQAKQVSSQDKAFKANKRNTSALKKYYSKAERSAYLNRERKELPEEFNKYGRIK